MDVQLEGIPSGESFGNLPQATTTYLAGIPTGESLGVPTWNRNVSLTGIATAQSIGTPSWHRYYPLLPITSEEHVPGLSGANAYELPDAGNITRPLRTLSVAERFSTPVVTQNAAPTDSVDLSALTGSVAFGVLPVDSLDLSDGTGTFSVYQEFYPPRDYVRASTTSEARIPPLTGFQVLVQVGLGFKDTATLDWVLERQEIGTGWVKVTSGTEIGAAREGEKVWLTVYYDEAVDVLNEWIDDRFRIGLRARDVDVNVGELMELVPYENGEALVNSAGVQARLAPGIPFPFIDNNDVYSVLYKDAASGKVYNSTQRGITSLWATSPNPLVTASVKAYESDGETPLTINMGGECSLNFRVLSGSAEEGTDFLGNRFRSSVIKNDIATVDTAGSSENYWQSKPNPSKFAVEALYFDISNFGQAATVDHILLDPTTPGVYFNVYYSSEGDAGTNEVEWEEKLWERVPNIFQAKERYSHPMPQPITAKYMKVEFTHLQPRWYGPGNFQRPILFKKHPKWVLDYFLTRIASEQDTEDPFVARRVGVRYDALSLAYEYYLDDLDQNPLSSQQLGIINTNEISKFLSDRTDESDQVSQDTLNQIRTQLAPYTNALAYHGKLDYLPSVYTIGAASALVSGERVLSPDNPSERAFIQTLPNNQVSSIRREALVLENNYPVMNFFINCRHNYREATASFRDDKAYFAGVKEIAFLRDRYTEASDTPTYIESAGDSLNTERNDFELDEGLWTVYSTADLNVT